MSDDNKPQARSFEEWLQALSAEERQKFMNARRKISDAKNAHRNTMTYQLEITPELYADLHHVTLLNRRMLDRSPEHEIFNHFLSRLQKMCRDQADASWIPSWPADVPQPPDAINPYKRHVVEFQVTLPEPVCQKKCSICGAMTSGGTVLTKNESDIGNPGDLVCGECLK